MRDRCRKLHHYEVSIARDAKNTEDLREVVDHDRDRGSVHDLLEEADDSSSVVTHSESEVPCHIRG